MNGSDYLCCIVMPTHDSGNAEGQNRLDDGGLLVPGQYNNLCIRVKAAKAGYIRQPVAGFASTNGVISYDDIAIDVGQSIEEFS